MRNLDYVISSNEDGMKVYDVLRKHIKLSANLVKRNKRYPDGIMIDGVHVTTRDNVSTGQVLSFRLSDYERTGQIIPVPGPIDIVYEDDDMIILNKPAGVVVHPCPGHLIDTLGNFLLAYYDSKNDTTDFHPVHRLDIGTTGLLIIAKNPYVQDKLIDNFHTEDFQRYYFAICEGIFEEKSGTVNAPIAREFEDSLTRVIREDGKESITHYEVVSEYNNRSLVKLKLETGRTHQIRLHMAYIGHKLLGDSMYGGNCDEISRPALHSCEMKITHPMTNEIIDITCSLPDDMKKLIENA
ncbi:MAG: RluA family pseudouridine synthase [Clostridia bacterium]|nr:RluA family pseudouridine synthase [Clostridia bacterium]